MDEKRVTKRIFTTCSEAYDYSQAKTVNPFVGRTTNGRGKIIREVEITESEYRVNYQIDRYRSGLELVSSPEEFAKLVEAGCVRLKDQLVEREPDPALGD